MSRADKHDHCHCPECDYPDVKWVRLAMLEPVTGKMIVAWVDHESYFRALLKSEGFEEKVP